MKELNIECGTCPLKMGCHILVAFNPNDVLEPPCGKYVIGLAGGTDDATFWTIPKNEYIPLEEHPKNLKFVI